MTFCAIAAMPSRCIGFGHTLARGIKAGSVIDLAEAEAAIRQCADVAERTAKMQLNSVIVSISSGRPASELIPHPSMLPARASASGISRGCSLRAAGIPCAKAAQCCTRCRLAMRSMTRPACVTLAACWRSRFGIDMHVVTTDLSVARNLMLTVERCHLERGGDGRLALCRPGCPCLPMTRPISEPRWSTWARAPPPLPCSLADNSFMRTGLRSAAAT